MNINGGFNQSMSCLESDSESGVGSSVLVTDSDAQEEMLVCINLTSGVVGPY